ncbi:HEAT repeat domain-containing protein [Streptomyces lavenduligriseus]|uniref:HEAT repeat domain-containing protein n=1 Tax=Streptomyces lavenduligriseus TaxID=67315 RepID=A0ABT0NZW9_9ACTN|nr:HEAT repeat domain-containing protein [Streptomyces lavenduligriseus]MCL3997032.1 HEAT repeat domain-containing protein [Streptomyces lavenduligriseus]
MRAGTGEGRGRTGRERDTGVARLWMAGDLDGLCRALEGPDALTAARAAEVLGEPAFGAEGGAALIRCLERCEPLLTDPDFGSYNHDRSWPLIEAVRALGRRREQRAVPALCRLLDREAGEGLRYRLETAAFEALIAIGAWAEASERLLERFDRQPEPHLVWLLTEAPHPRALEPVLARVWRLLPYQLAEAVGLLAAFRDPSTAPALLHIVTTAEATHPTRRAALRALLELPGPERWLHASRIEPLVGRLRGPDRETARLAGHLLARTEQGRARMRGLLKDPQGRWPRKHRENVPDSYPREAYPYEAGCVVICEVMTERPQAFVSPSRGALRSAEEAEAILPLLDPALPAELRRAAVRALGAFGAVDSRAGRMVAAALLERALPDRRTVETAAATLARLPEPPVRELLRLLGPDGGRGHEGTPVSRRGAALALGLLRHEAAAPGLLAALAADEPPALRRAAADALGLLGHRPAVPALVALAGDEEEATALRARAVTALGRIGAHEALPALLGAARSDSESLRLRAAGSLGSFPAAEAVAALTDLASDTEPETVRAAVDSLARIGPPAASALCALPDLAGHDRRPGDTLRALVTALAACPGPECTTALARLAHPPYSQSVRAAAERALAGRPAAEALPHLLRLLADPMMRHPHGPALLALARSGAPEAEAIVVEHFEHQRSFVADRYRDEAREALRVLCRAGAP